jgi:hypothetical protein
LSCSMEMFRISRPYPPSPQQKDRYFAFDPVKATFIISHLWQMAPFTGDIPARLGVCAAREPYFVAGLNLFGPTGSLAAVSGPRDYNGRALRSVAGHSISIIARKPTSIVVNHGVTVHQRQIFSREKGQYLRKGQI